MDNYTLSSDNKGILSLLSAIEQSSSQDNFDPDTSPSKMIDKEFPNLQNQLNLESIEMGSDIHLANFSCCLICGRNPEIESNESMVDILTEVNLPGEKGATLYSVLEDIISLNREHCKSSALACIECYSILDAIAKLRVQINEYISVIESKYEDWNTKKSRFPTVSDYTSVLELKMPLNIFNVKDEDISTKKSKLQILAETLEGEHSALSPIDITDEIDHHLSLNKENELDADADCQNCGESFRISKKKPSKLCGACTKGSRMKPPASRSFSCGYCFKKFKSRGAVSEHVKQKHVADVHKSYQCENCPETFSSKHNKLAHHRLIHKGSAKALACDECGDSFQTFQALQYHRSKHTGDFSFNCQYCNKGFNNFKLMEEHSHIHTGDKPYVCTHCNQKFANRGSLWLHVKKHNVKKPYVCDYCNKEFGHSSHLVVHKRLHTGESPYKCRFCSEGFISGNHLKRHMRSHQNELPFACGLCGKPFGKRSELVKHGNSEHKGNVVDEVAVPSDPSVIPDGDANSLPVLAEAEPTQILDSEPKQNFGSEQPEQILVEEDSGRLPENFQAGPSKEYILVDSGGQERILSGGGEYVLPVDLLEGAAGGKDGDQTIVFIEVQQNQFIQQQTE